MKQRIRSSGPDDAARTVRPAPSTRTSVTPAPLPRGHAGVSALLKVTVSAVATEGLARVQARGGGFVTSIS